MVRRIIFSITGLLIASLCPAQNGHNIESLRGQTSGSTAQEVLEVKRQYDNAQLKNDSAWFERMFADDYIAILPDGEMLTKARAVQELRKREITWDSVRAEDSRVRVYADTAVVTGRFYGRGKYRGKPMDERQWFTSVWVKRNGRWQAIAEHFTGMPASK